jgi:hypothetical protein
VHINRSRFVVHGGHGGQASHTRRTGHCHASVGGGEQVGTVGAVLCTSLCVVTRAVTALAPVAAPATTAAAGAFALTARGAVWAAFRASWRASHRLHSACVRSGGVAVQVGAFGGRGGVGAAFAPVAAPTTTAAAAAIAFGSIAHRSLSTGRGVGKGLW